MPTRWSVTPTQKIRVAGRWIIGGFDGGEITSDAGDLLLGKTDAVIRRVDRPAGCFQGRRDAELIEHSVRTRVLQRVVGLAPGHEDLNDYDELRRDLWPRAGFLLLAHFFTDRPERPPHIPFAAVRLHH